MSNESFNDFVVFDLESLSQVHGSDFYNISYDLSGAEAPATGAPTTPDSDEVVVGDRFYDTLAGEIEVIYVSEFGQIVTKFSDNSISLFECLEDIEDDGFVKVLETSGFIAVIRDTDSNEIFFDDGVYLTEQAAIDAFERNKLSTWELLDTTPISWSNKNEA